MPRTSWFPDITGPARNEEGHYYVNGWVWVNSFPFKVKRPISKREWKWRSQVRTLINCYLLTHVHELAHWAGGDHPNTIKECDRWDKPLQCILKITPRTRLEKRKTKRKSK